MSTDRVKNVLIVLLSLIALSLGLLIFVTEGRYSLSAAQEASVVAILERDDVFFQDGANIVRDFRPLRQLAMQRYDYDLNSLAARFFGDAGFQVNVEYPDYTFFLPGNQDRTMFYSSWTNRVTFQMARGMSSAGFEAEPGAETAAALATEQIERLMGMPPDMRHFSTSQSRAGNWVVDFFTVYRGFVVLDDHIRVYVSERGITSIEYSRVLHYGFEGDAHNIFAPNEALMALVNHMRREQMVGTITIDDMRMAYFLAEERGQSVGMPVYVFVVELAGDMRLSFIFNAFTNELLQWELLL